MVCQWCKSFKKNCTQYVHNMYKKCKCLCTSFCCNYFDTQWTVEYKVYISSCAINIVSMGSFTPSRSFPR